MSATQTAHVYTLAQLADDLAQEHAAADAARAAGKHLGPVIPHPRLAAELGGYWSRGVVGLHAQPGCGKSAWAISTVLFAECPSIYLTCEMSAHTVLRRMIACESGEFLGRLAPGQISSERIRALANALAAKHPHVAIVGANTAPCPPGLVRTICKRMQQLGDHLLIGVDSLHAWAAAIDPEREEYQSVSAGVEALRRIADEYRASIIAIVERNRASMTTGGISAGAASRKIEYSSEVIIELKCVEPGRINLRLAKNRNGREGVTIGYEFEGATQRFREIGDPWPTGARSSTNGRSHHLDAEPADAGVV